MAAISCNVRDVRERVRESFRSLRKQGFIAKMDFSCCSNCAGYELVGIVEGLTEAKRKKFKGAIYFHHQRHQAFSDGHDLYINYGNVTADGVEHGLPSIEIGMALADTLRAHGLVVIWSGSADETIAVKNRVYCSVTVEMIEALRPKKNGMPVAAITPIDIFTIDVPDKAEDIRNLVRERLLAESYEAIAEEYDGRTAPLETIDAVIATSLEYVNFSDDSVAA